MTKKKPQAASKTTRKAPGKTSTSSTGQAKPKTPTRSAAGKRPSFSKPKIQVAYGAAARKAREDEAQRPHTLGSVLIRLLPVWALLIMVLILEPTLPLRAFGGLARVVGDLVPRPPAVQQPAEPVFIVEGSGGPSQPDNLPTPSWSLEISPVFAPGVRYWADDIAQWSLTYRIKPNLIATLMQIESCGNPAVASEAGALGLFQVLPLHFAEGEDPFDPATNAQRGLTFFAQMYAQANGDLGLAFAAYNGGPGIIGQSPAEWPAETQNYQFWGSGIYEEAESGLQESPTLMDWLDSGGASLCSQASEALGLEPAE